MYRVATPTNKLGFNEISYQNMGLRKLSGSYKYLDLADDSTY